LNSSTDGKLLRTSLNGSISQYSPQLKHSLLLSPVNEEGYSFGFYNNFPGAYIIGSSINSTVNQQAILICTSHTESSQVAIIVNSERDMFLQDLNDSLIPVGIVVTNGF
jgi:hypothetical protein